MRSTIRGIAVIAAALGVSLALVSLRRAQLRAAPPAPNAVQQEAVESDMHEFMEYVFEPAYKRLKAAMASSAPDNSAWKTIKSDSLTLAEGGNLLLVRVPEQEGDVWSKSSIAVRNAGKSLYEAAKKKDYQQSRDHYQAMLQKCNACHTRFANGEHQLSP
jgi:hypothetical protein